MRLVAPEWHIQRRIWPCAYTLALLIWITGGCSTRVPLPDIPNVNTSGFLPSVREAVEQASSAARSKPQDPATVGHLGMVLHAHDQLGAAEQAYRRAEALDKTERRVEWTYYRGVVLLLSGKPAEAGPLLEAAAASKRTQLPALIKAGEAYLAAGNTEKAGIMFRQAVETSPGDASAHFGLGRATKNPTEYEKALEIFPSYGAAMFSLAQSLQRSGQADRAKSLLASYEKFKTATPPLDDPFLDAVAALNAGPTNLVRKAQAAAANGDLPTAIDLHLQAIKLDPKMTQAHVNLISLYARTNQPEKAAASYATAITANPNLAEAHYNYGVLLYSAQGKLAEAKAMFEKAIAADPSHAPAHHNLGAILQQQGQLAAAQREFEQAVTIDPGSRNSRFQLGRLYVNAGRNADAIKQFEKIVEIDDEMTPTYLYALAATIARTGDASKTRTLLFAAREKAAARSQTQLLDSIDRDLARMRK